MIEVLLHPGDIRGTTDPQRVRERSTPDRRPKAVRCGVQPRTPSRPVARTVDDDGDGAVPRRSDHPKQFGGQLALPASDTCTHRSLRGAVRTRADHWNLALDHSSVYPYSGVDPNRPNPRPS